MADYEERRLCLERAVVPLSQLPEKGRIPERESSAAVIYLRRLARNHPLFEEIDLADWLCQLAHEINEALPQELRVAFDDPRAEAPYEVTARAALEAAVSVLTAYHENPSEAALALRRIEKYSALERYFVWARTMAHASQELDSRVQSQRATLNEADAICALDDFGEAQVGRVLHWLAALYCVIEGWEELKLSDPVIDSLLAKGGSDRDNRSLRYRLKRLRHGVFHYQPGTSPRHIRDYFDQSEEEGAWTIGLERAFERFFRLTWESQQSNIDVWLHRPG